MRAVKLLCLFIATMFLNSCNETPPQTVPKSNWFYINHASGRMCIIEFYGHSYILLQGDHGVAICHDENCMCKIEMI